MRMPMKPSLLAIAIALMAACGAVDPDATDTTHAPLARAPASSEALRAAPALHEVAQPRTKRAGMSAANALARELVEAVVAQGATPVENPMTVSPSPGVFVQVATYGYVADGPFLPAWGDVPSGARAVEATKTEPGDDTYLVLDGLRGADPDYDYGRHFLFQGHERGPVGFVTRINLDADAAHAVTIVASTDARRRALPTFRGSAWDPFAQRLLFTSRDGDAGGVWQATLDFPAVMDDLVGSLGRAGYDGVQVDDAGDVWLVEDAAGALGAVHPHARQPNGFLYRFVPERRGDLTRGALEALQVVSRRSGEPIAFHDGRADDDVASDDALDLHTYGVTLRARWVPIHDTAIDGSAPFDANALAKARRATPFKRPTHGRFRPGSGFTQLYFDEAGDGDARTEAGAERGGFGAIFALTRSSASADEGTLTMRVRGDVAHTGFDGVAFWGRDQVLVAEDAGDALHTQREAFDSAYLVDVRADYADPARRPLRVLALGRDASATIDAALAGAPGFRNGGDNAIAGVVVSNGDPSPRGLLGAAVPRPLRDGWRVFCTQQHGDDVTWEILPRRGDAR